MPGEQPDADGDENGYADGDMDRDQDQHPVLDPDPIPNIVLHPGDTLAIGVGGAIRLLDRNGRCYAVLDCERNALAARYRIDAIRFVSAIGQRELLPVRAEPDAQPDADADADADHHRSPGNPYPFISGLPAGGPDIDHWHRPRPFRHTHPHRHPGASEDAHAHSHGRRDHHPVPAAPDPGATG